MPRIKSLLVLGLSGICALAAWGFVGDSARTVSGQVAGGGAAVLELPPIHLPPGVPLKVEAVLRYIDENGEAPPGYVGGRVFTNDGRGGEEVLPRVDLDGDPIEYHEWDVNRRNPRKNRGTERLVTGTDGSAYYTDDHYQTFKVIRGPEPDTRGERSSNRSPPHCPRS
jgi:guanyl-specific ribonuclease Sa